MRKAALRRKAILKRKAKPAKRRAIRRRPKPVVMKRKASPRKSLLRRNINAPRRLVEGKISSETFELPIHDNSGARRWQESKAAELHQQYARPLEVPPIPQPSDAERRKSVAMPHLATSALAALLLAAIAFAFFSLVMNFEPLYASAVAVPVFVVFSIMINSMLEKKGQK